MACTATYSSPGYSRRRGGEILARFIDAFFLDIGHRLFSQRNRVSLAGILRRPTGKPANFPCQPLNRSAPAWYRRPKPFPHRPMHVPIAVCGPSLLQQDAGTLFRLLLLAPLLEEWIARAGLQAWLLRRMAPAPALLASTAAFSALHLGAGPLAAALVSGPGLLMGWTYQHWRDWRLCALLHGLCNALAMICCRLQLY
jgi:uncharacterized protein